MPSPFPGMDPYIESGGYWGEFHTHMIVEMQIELNSVLPKGYAASIDLYVWIHEPTAERRTRRVMPDAYVSKSEKRSRKSASVATVSAATQIVLPSLERRRQRSIKVVDLEQERVVTAVELLSPSNKLAGEDHDAYITKRNEYIANRVNLVEIDLLRSGGRLPMGDPRGEAGEFYVLASKAWEYPRADFWPFTLRDVIPTVTVPIVEEIDTVPFDLQATFTRVYNRYAYNDKLRYDRRLTPRPSKSDAAWIKTRLTSE